MSLTPASPPDHFPIPGRQDATPVEVARYIGEIAGQLALLAGAQRMPMLTYFFEYGARRSGDAGV